jgi:hypothetical protein
VFASCIYIYIYTFDEVTTAAETIMAYFFVEGKCLSAKLVALFP